MERTHTQAERSDQTNQQPWGNVQQIRPVQSRPDQTRPDPTEVDLA